MAVKPQTGRALYGLGIVLILVGLAVGCWVGVTGPGGVECGSAFFGSGMGECAAARSGAKPLPIVLLLAGAGLVVAALVVMRSEGPVGEGGVG